MSDAEPQNQKARQRWMGILAKAESTQLLQRWQSLGQEPDYDFIRKPETGLTMIRGRTGGSGQPFNMGEMTLCRCAIRLANGTLGISYVPGRNTQHTLIAALADALLQNSDTHDQLQRELITPLYELQQQTKADRANQAYSTKVDFFTLVRGED